MWMVMPVAAVILAGCGGGESAEVEPVGEGTDSPALADEPSQRVLSEIIQIESIEATSFLRDSDPVLEEIRYSPIRALDGNRQTAWVEDTPDSGIGERFTVRLAAAAEADRIRVLPGYFDSRYWVENNRVAALLVTLIDSESGERRSIDLRAEDARRPVEQSFESTVFDRFTVEIREVHRGQSWDVTCLSEIAFSNAGSELAVMSDDPPIDHLALAEDHLNNLVPDAGGVPEDPTLEALARASLVRLDDLVRERVTIGNPVIAGGVEEALLAEVVAYKQLHDEGTTATYDPSEVTPRWIGELVAGSGDAAIELSRTVSVSPDGTLSGSREGSAATRESTDPDFPGGYYTVSGGGPPATFVYYLRDGRYVSFTEHVGPPGAGPLRIQVGDWREDEAILEQIREADKLASENPNTAAMGMATAIKEMEVEDEDAARSYISQFEAAKRIDAIDWAVATVDELDAAIADGLDVNGRGSSGLTPIALVASHGGDPRIAYQLRNRGADPTQPVPDGGSHAEPPIYRAIDAGAATVVAFLMESETAGPARVDSTDAEGRSPLVYAAANASDARVIELLVQAGADPTATFNGMTLAQIAAENPALAEGELTAAVADGASADAASGGLPYRDDWYGTLP